MLNTEPTVILPSEPVNLFTTTCDKCGEETKDPWHTSVGTNRHVHFCDKCYGKTWISHIRRLTIGELRAKVEETERCLGDNGNWKAWSPDSLAEAVAERAHILAVLKEWDKQIPG